MSTHTKIEHLSIFQSSVHYLGVLYRNPTKSTILEPDLSLLFINTKCLYKTINYTIYIATVYTRAKMKLFLAFQYSLC